MAVIPNSNLTGLPEVTATDLKNFDPARINRIFRLLATQVHGVQTGAASPVTNITNVTQNGGGGGGGSSSSSVASATITIQGTHAQRLSTYLPASEPAGSYYYETDRTVTYLNFVTPSTDQVWQWVSGTMFGHLSVRPADLTQYDDGFLFYATDIDVTYQWTGTAWQTFSEIGVVLFDTHANHLTNYQSVNYAVGSSFYETDRTVSYIVENAAGTVTVSGGTTVTWTAGNHFINTGSGFTLGQWPSGTPIVINGLQYVIASVTSPTVLVLASAAPNGAGKSYSVASGRWVYIEGRYDDVFANQPSDLGENDAGFQFYATNTYVTYSWSGTAWSVIGEVGACLADTHANRLANYPSVLYPLGALFYETDRTAIYISQNALGVVTVSGGTTVTWTSGDQFINTGSGFSSTQWPSGTPIVINGIQYAVSSVSSSTVLTLASAAPNGAGKSYSVVSGLWVYIDGRYTDVFANLPTDLGENDYSSSTAGFEFFDTTHWRLFQWTPNGAAPSSATPGWQRGEQELPTGSIQILPFGGGQMASGWHLCDGTASVTITQDDATTTTVTTPNLVGAYPKGGTTGTYSPTPHAAVVPTIGGHTEVASTGITVSSATVSTGTALSGATQAVVTALTSGGGAVTDPQHQHNLTSADAPITLPGDPVKNVVVPFYMKL